MATDSAPIQERNLPSPEEEIRQLEQKLEEKKRALAEQAGIMPSEGEIRREVMREYAKEVQPAPSPVPEESLIPGFRPGTPSAPVSAKDDAIKAAAREEHLTALVRYAMAHTIAGAIQKAGAESPYLLDALHDRLAAEYDKLVALKKVKKL